MKLRTAKKILRRWSLDFPSTMRPRDAHGAGLLPWTWGTWVEAHRLVAKRQRRPDHPDRQPEK